MGARGPSTKKPKLARKAAGGRGAAAARLRKVRVRTRGAAGADYEVLIGAGHLAASVAQEVGAGGALAVVDAGLPRDVVEPVIRAIDRKGVRWGVCVVTASEVDKSLATVERIVQEAAAMRLERSGTLVALGGGVVGDVAGFAAAVYRRGVRVVQCPTTLLAMVDASVGGKTAVNVSVRRDDSRPRLLKNMAGAFHQPARVVCDALVLRSLAIRHLRCGLAECIKHGVLGRGLGDARLLDWTEKRLGECLGVDARTIAELVARNVALKARIVSKDPFETGARDAGAGRAALNLGHTFAHALETLPGLSWRGSEGRVVVGPLLHGEAVGLGLIAAMRLAARLKLATPALAERVHSMVRRVDLPVALRGLPPAQAVMERMADDKKVEAGRLRLVLPTRSGSVGVVENAPPRLVAEAIDSLRDAGG